MMPTKIDAVALVRRIRDAQYEQLKDQSVAEQIRYFREKAATLAQLLEESSQKATPESKNN
jgi:hypothetical protein